jgi:hypothetical protein
MDYLEWNNIISEYFFNPANAGKNIHLYITKTDIIHLGGKHFIEESEDEIWHNFVIAIKHGLPGSKGNITAKAKYTYEKRKLLKINSVEIKYPPYITYLVFFVLPLIEGLDGTYSANNYYDRLNRLLQTNHINETIGTNDFRNNQINELWDALSKWANITKKGDFGYFQVIPFTNTNWIYVGKIFSQCIFPPRAITRLPILFFEAGMIPDSHYSPLEIKKYLLQYGSSVLNLSSNTINVINKSDTDELGLSILETVKQEYYKWTGESHFTDEGVPTKRNYVTSRIYSQIQIFSNQGKIEFSFRIKSTNDFPEDLKLNGFDIREEKYGYSKTIHTIPFKDSFQLIDDFNMWIAKFPDKDIRLFISGGSLQFSTDYWIETDNLNKTNRMYLLCKNSKRDMIDDWLKNHCSEFEDESDYEGLPENHSLFRFSNPNEGIDSIPELRLFKEKSIRLISALRIDFRTFTNDIMPEVEIFNADGTESVYLQYKNCDNKNHLKKKTSSNNCWLLPDNIFLYADFNIRVEGETFKENETTYKIISSNDSTIIVDEKELPIRGLFGQIVNGNIGQYSIGNSVIGGNLDRQQPYMHLFKGITEDTFTDINSSTYSHSEGNMLISYLSLKKKTTAKDFYSAFEQLHSKYFGNMTQNDNFNYSKIKKTSLKFFDYLGYLDYEYETKTIIVNPPQLIFIPASKGRKVLLIGERNESLMNKIIEKSPAFDLQVEIQRQFQSNEDLLLPDVVTLKSFGSEKNLFGEKNLIAFAKELNIIFNHAEVLQVSLQQLCGNINEYEKEVLSKQEKLTFEDWDWTRYQFNPETLQLEQSSGDFDKTFSLLEYRLRPWEYHHRLWVDHKCYNVDVNWGKFLVLKRAKKNVILYDSESEKVAIPTSLALPKLLAKSIMLSSGFAPVYKNIEGNHYRVYQNIPSIFIKNLFDKLEQQTKEYKI